MSAQELLEEVVERLRQEAAAAAEEVVEEARAARERRNRQFVALYQEDFTEEERAYLAELGAAPEDSDPFFGAPYLRFYCERVPCCLTVNASGRWGLVVGNSAITWLRDEHVFVDLLELVGKAVLQEREYQERLNEFHREQAEREAAKEQERREQQEQATRERERAQAEREARLEEQRRVSNEIAPTIMAAEKAAREGAFTWPETGVYLLVWQVEYTERRDEDMRDIRVVRYQRYEPSEPDALGSWFTFEVDTQHPSESQILLHWIASLPKVEKLLLTADPATWPDALAEETFFTVSDVGVLYEEEGKFFTPCKGLVTQVSLGRQPVAWVREIVERVDESNKGKR